MIKTLAVTPQVYVASGPGFSGGITTMVRHPWQHTPDLPPVQANPLTGPPPQKGTSRFVVIGDAGSGTRIQQDIASRMLHLYFEDNQPFASVLMLGDNVYRSGHPHRFESRLHRPYKPLYRDGVRFYPVLGNHDIRGGHGDRQLRYFGINQPFYRFSQGPVDFFAINTMLLFPGQEKCYTQDPDRARRLGAVQLVWLDRALGESQAPFKIVYGHHPIYPVAPWHQNSDSTRQLQALLEPLLARHRVNLYLAGHDHLYQRSRLKGGTMQIISGAAGKLRDAPPNAPANVAVRASRNHFMVFDILDNRSLLYRAMDKDGNLLDVGLLTGQGRRIPPATPKVTTRSMATSPTISTYRPPLPVAGNLRAMA